MKKLFSVFIILGSLAASLFLLWEYHLSYYMPKESNQMTKNDLSDLSFINDSSIYYLHFYNANCLNSRINIEHIPRVTDKYKSKAKFILINTGSPLDENVDIPNYYQTINDPEGVITQFCGVKVTPYAVIHKKSVGSFYSNYNNKNGLCGASDITYSGPSVALNFLMQQNNFPLLPPFQQSQIGCEIQEILL